MPIFSAVFITLSVPIAYILLILNLYCHKVAWSGIGGTLSSIEMEVKEAEYSEHRHTSLWQRYEKRIFFRRN
ncbi:MAG: hypothetical protein LUO98_04220 [Methanoregula sp.]|nr:hypothetical protein [Methanoregula sp.]